MLSIVDNRRLSESVKRDRRSIRFNTQQHKGQMDKVGGNRNYGYGKQLAWAGKNALVDHCGHGKFSTRASHAERWNQFVNYLKAECIKDARQINQQTIESYAVYLRDQVDSEEMKVAYAQNLLSTINVVMEAMRKDKALAKGILKHAFLLRRTEHPRPIT